MQKLLTFFQQTTSELDIVLTRTVNILTNNELVKLTILFLLKKKMLVAFANAKATHSKCKSHSHFFSKNTCELDNVLTRTVNILTTNVLVKLQYFAQLGPAFHRYCKGGHLTQLYTSIGFT